MSKQPLADDAKLANRWLKQQKTKSQGLLTRAIAFGSLNGLVMIGQMALLAWIIDGAIFQQQSLTDLQPWLLALAGVVVSRAILAYASERYSQRAAAKIKHQI